MNKIIIEGCNLQLDSYISEEGHNMKYCIGFIDIFYDKSVLVIISK
jgi:hypothetical protein